MARIVKVTFLTLIFSGIVICGYFTITGFVRAANPEAIAQEAFDYVNEIRASRGMVQLAWDSDLAEKALNHSEYMHNTGHFEHSALPYIENILDGWGAFLGICAFDRGWKVIDEWIRSPEHATNLFNEDIRRGAIGIKGNYATFLAK